MNKLTRRTLICSSAAALVSSPLLAAMRQDRLDDAAKILRQASDSGQVRASAFYVRDGASVFTESFGEAKSPDASFLLGSISKPIAMTALMTLYDKKRFRLDDPVRKYLPEFTGGAKDRVTIQHLLTHVSGLPDQLPENAELRSSHSPLSEFVKGAIRVPLAFDPGTQYQYSSMAIMLAAEIAQRLSDTDIRDFVNTGVLQPLGMQHSALGVGKLSPDNMMQCQVEFGAVESGAGSAESKTWDWNSSYWRQLGAPWGGVNASASDVGRFLDSFLHPKGTLFRADVAELMIRNHNAEGLTPRGLGFDFRMASSCPTCSARTFGHTGSTGTIAWADPDRDRICVVLTTLPARAISGDQHPRLLVSNAVAARPSATN